jgi:hypothetical protein
MCRRKGYKTYVVVAGFEDQFPEFTFRPSMAPIAIEAIDPAIKDVAPPRKDTLNLPEPTRKRLEKAGIDLSAGYPYRPLKPLYLDDVYNIRNKDREYVDAGSRADPEKKALLSAASEVIHLTSNIGTEIKGLQLKDLTNQQRDELALLIAERSVVFFRDQDITPQQQRELGEYYGEVEVHVSLVISNVERYTYNCHSPKSPKSRESSA